MDLTQKQQEVLDFIQAYFAKQGMAPSVREIAEALGKSAQAIQQHIESLRAKGYLQHQPSKSRTNVPLHSQIYTSEPGQRSADCRSGTSWATRARGGKP